MAIEEQIKTVLSELQDSSRFYKIETQTKIWFYDSHSHSLISISRQSFDKITMGNANKFISELNLTDATKILNFITMVYKHSNDTIPVVISDNRCNVMINVSNRCNLNCSYCYRNKGAENKIEIDTIDEIFDFIQNKFKPNASEYIVSYSMTSESSIDLPLLKKIAERYTKYENYQFTIDDISDDNIDIFFERIRNDLIKKVDYIEPIKNKEDIAVFLNYLMNNFDVFELLNMTYGMFPLNKKTEIQDRKSLSMWRKIRVNRWCLELYYESFVKQREIPHVCFWFMTNGTCASKEFINFIKLSTIDPLWISIDGPQKVHDENRKFVNNNPSYNQIVSNIKIFRENGIKLRASVVLTSIFPKPLEIVNHLLSLGFSSFSMTPVRPGSSVSFNEDNISELIKGYDLIYEELKKQSVQRDFSLFMALKEDMTLAAFNILTSRMKQIKRCDFGSQLVIDSNGEIYPCLYFVGNKEYSYGNIHTEYKKRFNDEQLSVYARDDCKKCWARYLCGGTCFYASKVSTGSCLGIYPVECKLKKHLVEKCLELLIFMKEQNIDIYKLY